MKDYIDKNLKSYNSKIFLAKPNRTIITKLNEAYNINIKCNYGGIHEVSFRLPFFIVKNHKKYKNKNIDILRGNFLLKIDNEWYVVNKPRKVADNGIEVLEVIAYSLPYELGNKRVAVYKPMDSSGVLTPKKASEVISDCLKDTVWTVGYVDADFNLRYRLFDLTEITRLDFLFKIAETFDGILRFDTENKKVDLYKYQLLGSDKGLSIKYGKYLKTLEEETDFDNVCTRLYVYGKDGLTINSVTPTGVNYVEDFSYYIYPYSETITNVVNDTYIVNKHSNYMTDGLCHAILKYNKLLEVKEVEFQNLLAQKATKQQELTVLQNQLTTLQIELQIIQDNLDVWQSTHDGQVNQTLLNEKNAKLSAINSKNTEITNKTNEINNIDTQINALKNLVKVENNFTLEQIKERDSFIHEHKWADENYFDAKELYNRSKTEIKKISQPLVYYKIDIIDFLKVVECQRDWDRLNLGDIITIKYDNFGIDIKAKIITIEHDFDGNTISLEIANDKDLKQGYLKIQELLQKVSSTSTAIDLNKYKWQYGEEALGKIGELFNNKFDANKNAIVAGTNENYTFDRQGLTMKDPNDPLNYLRMIHNVLAFTNDGGNSFKHAITSTGIIAEYLLGKIILGQNLIIGDAKGEFEIVGNLLTVKDNTDKIRVKLGEYATGKYGLQLKNKNGTDVIVDEDGIIQTDTLQEADNVDATHPLKLKFYIDEGIISVKKVKLAFSLEKFRAYETGASNNDQEILATTAYNENTGDMNYNSMSNFNSTGSSDVSLPSYSISNDGGHSHDGYDTTGKHSHNISKGYGSTSHSHSLSISHTHRMSHLHNITVPAHTHGIIYGIYEGSLATGVKIKIDGTERLNNGGTGYTTDQSNLDLTQWITAAGWHTIELTSTQLGRINASLYIKSFVGV